MVFKMHIWVLWLSPRRSRSFGTFTIPEQPAVHGPLHQNVPASVLPYPGQLKQRESDNRGVCGVTPSH